MNPRSIKKRLNAKFEDYLQSIDDDIVQGMIKDNSIITGGSIASMLLNEPVKDFDIYFANQTTAQYVANYYVDKFIELNPQASVQPKVIIEGDRVKIWVQSAGVTGEGEEGDYEYFEGRPNEVGDDYVDRMTDNVTDRMAQEPSDVEDDRPPYRPIFLSPNAITLSNKIQLVIRFYGTPEEIHANYDFVHATCHWAARSNKLVTPKAALLSLLTRNIVYQGSLYPVCSVFRCRKFLRQGWYIDAGQMLKMAMQISQLDLTDYATLEEQLVGVDAAYFFQVLEYIQEKRDEDEKFELSSTYLVSIIDRIWNYDVG